VVPARLTVTFGFGSELVRRAGADAPAWLRPLPAFGIDRLDDAWSGGDLLVQVAADDQLTVALAVRMLLKDTRRFATVRWTQSGFRRARGSEASTTTMRNLFGQVDGTVNPEPGTTDFDGVVWARDGWLAGSTSMVVRRIAMNLDTWDRLDRDGREQSVGRRLSDGAPLSSGLVFIAFQADVDTQYVPLQRRLDELDLLNDDADRLRRLRDPAGLRRGRVHRRDAARVAGSTHTGAVRRSGTGRAGVCGPG